jgi:hypothetical protein
MENLFIQPPPAVMPVPYWTESTKATDCTTCGRDIWVGERCVVSGPTIHCRLCGTKVCCYEDDGQTREFGAAS